MITVTFCLYIKQSGGIRTENKVYTQSELKAQNIITTDYVPNLEPGEFIAVLDMKAEARNCLRVFFTFEDGRKIMAAAQWWQRYLGFYFYSLHRIWG